MTGDQALAIQAAIGELCNPKATIDERVFAAEMVRKAFGMPVDHADDCVCNTDDADGGDCNCNYWNPPATTPESLNG
jgi:hypothetical protein